MTGASQHHGAPTLQNPVYRQLLRRVILFLAFLMSGGMLIYPRPVLLVAVGVLCLFLQTPLRPFRREFAGIWILLFVLFGVALIGGGDFNVGSNLVRLANFLAAIPLLCLYIDEGRDSLARDAFPMLRLMAIQALITVVLAVGAPGLFRPIEVNETVYQSIFLIFNYHVTLQLEGLIPRPDGFFWEPGVFQIYLNIYLYLALFVFRKRWEAGLALVAVFATQSTTGAIIAGMLLLFAYAQSLQIAGRVQKLAVLVLAPILILPALAVVYQNVTDKLTGAFSGSAFARQYDFYTGMRIAAEYPLTGIGFDYERYYDEAQKFGYLETKLSDHNIVDRGNSNSFASMFASIGFPLGIMFIIGLFRQRFFKNRLLFGLLLSLSFIGEALIFTPFFLMFIFSGLLLNRGSYPASLPAGAAARPLPAAR